MARWPFDGAIYDWNGTFRNFLGSQAEGLILRTVAPGGCWDLEFSLQRKATLNYPDIDYPFDVRLYDNQGVFHRTRMERRTDELGDNAEQIQIRAINTIADYQGYASKVFALGTAIETAVSTVRTDLMPKVTAESLVATGRTLTAAYTIKAKKARAVLQALCDLGTSADVLLYWYVWPDGAADAYQLLLEAKPATAGYFVDIRNIRGRFGWDGEQYANKVTVIYNAGASNVSVQDTALQGTGPTGTNDIREKFLEVPDLANSTDATNLGNSALLVYKLLRGMPENAIISAPWAITDTNRQLVPLWRVRAGKRIAIRGLQPLRLGTVTDGRNTPFITQTEYNADTGVLSLHFENIEATLEGMIAKLKQRTEI